MAVVVRDDLAFAEKLASVDARTRAVSRCDPLIYIQLPDLFEVNDLILESHDDSLLDTAENSAAAHKDSASGQVRLCELHQICQGFFLILRCVLEEVVVPEVVQCQGEHLGTTGLDERL